MTPGVRNTVLACVAFMVLVVGLFVNNMMREPVLSDGELRELGIVILPTPREVTPFALVDERGEPFTQDDLVGHWTFAYFGFTHCPDICPVTLSVMGNALRELGDAGVADAFTGMLVSVDPERDTPEVLANYVPYFHPDFVGATGAASEIATLAAQVSVAYARVPAENGTDDYTMDHTGNLVIFNPRGHYLGLIRMPHTPQQIETAYRTLAARY
ncbi:MAG: SCO family protein [Pseudomonadales bacterium]|jgi:protein SCO1/2|nr:SCO family protein [Pseudomonadales bacterium]